MSSRDLSFLYFFVGFVFMVSYRCSFFLADSETFMHGEQIT